MNSTTRTFLAVISIGVITLCLALITQKVTGSARVDLTEDNLYTLSDGTRNIVGKLKQPITFKLYYSRVAAMKGPEQIRYWNNYYHYVHDLLAEYANLSNGMIRLEEIDPRPYSLAEEEAIDHGIKSFPLPGDETFFFGMVARTELGKTGTIEFFEPNRQQFVEYDVSKLINSVIRRDKKRIGVISSLPVSGSDLSPYMQQMMQMQGKQPEKAWTIIEHLRQEYEVSATDTTSGSVPDDVDFLMVIHPKDLSEKELYAIDQYVMNGGRLLVFTDPHCLADRPEENPQNPYAAMQHQANSSLNSLLSTWGVEMEEGAIAVDRKLALSVPMRQGQKPSPFLPYLQLRPENANDKEVITGELNSIRLLYSGVLRETAAEGVTVSPLLTTSEIGSIWQPQGPYELAMPDAAAIRKAVTDGTEKRLLAARLSGTFKSNYPDGLPADEEKSDDSKPDGNDADTKKENAPLPPALKSSTGSAEIVVVADVDMISDMLAYQQSFFGMSQSGDNSSFVFNAVDFLAGSPDLIAIRSRGQFSRPFDVVDEIELAAEKATEKEVAAIQEKIKNYQQELQSIGANGGADTKNAAIIKSTAIKKRREIEEEIRQANRELRTLQARRREKVEALASRLRLQNLILAPAFILAIAVALAIFRYTQAKRYAARRAQ